MPTFTAYPVADAYISYIDNYSGRGSVTWDEAATESVGTSFTDGSFLYLESSKDARGGNWNIRRPLLYFDLSSMPAAATISAATITFYAQTYDVNDTYGERFIGYLWDESTGIGTSDYDAFDTNYDSSTINNITSTGAGQIVNIQNTLLAWLQSNPQGDGSNNFPVIFRTHIDINSSSMVPTAMNLIVFRSLNYGGASRPLLTITYTVPSGYSNDVIGVDSGDISKVNGIATADISKVNGV